MRSGELTFPLVPRGRLLGLSFGTMRSFRRGTGSEVAGSRPYRPGDDVRAIDWGASARLSSARGSDIFVVRERYAEEAPRILIVLDRRPQMGHFGPPLPWLDKGAAMRRIVRLILHSAVQAGGYIGYLDFAGDRENWRPPQGERRLLEQRDQHVLSDELGAPPDTLERSFAFLAERRRFVQAGTFVFVLSDFVPSPSHRMWLTASEHLWDVVPVVISDPLWERSFPDVSGIEVPFVDPASGRVVPARLGRREAARLRAHNEERFASLREAFLREGVDPVLIGSNDDAEILGAFLDWAEQRRIGQRGAGA